MVTHPGRARTQGLGALAACAAVGAVLGSGFFVLRQSEALSYLSDDPRACVNCHVMKKEYDGWQHGSHHAVATCNDCHTPTGGLAKWEMKAIHGARHSYGFTFGTFDEPIRMKPDSAAVVENNCVRCHESLTADMGRHGLATRDGAGAVLVGSADFDLSCIHCHSGVGHGPRRN